MNIGLIRYLKSYLSEYNGVLTWNKTKNKLDNLRIVEKNYQGLPIKEEKTWKRAFYKLIISNPDLAEVAYEFYNALLYQEKSVKFDKQYVILISVEKNEKYRMKKLIEHYRKLGVKQFAIIDNLSTDGTFEYLKSQDDVAVFSAKNEYTTNRREAWINRVIAYYGRNRWYIIVDSDELLVYYECEQHNIEELIKVAEKKRITRARALMVDMYSKENFFSDNAMANDPYTMFTYFDTDSYVLEKCKEMDLVRGGFRGRIFESKPVLTKYPLIYFKKSDIQCKSHFLFPYRKNLDTKCYLALLHYKFLPGDLKKYKEIAQKGNFYAGSIQYKEYVRNYEEKNVQSPIYEGSKKYTDSRDLRYIKLIDLVNW